MHALSTLQEESVLAATAGPALDAAGTSTPPRSSRPSRPLAASRSLSGQSSAPWHVGSSDAGASDVGSLPASTSPDEQATSGGSSPPLRPDSGLRKAPRKGQGPVQGHRMSPAVLAAIVEWCQGRRADAGNAQRLNSLASSSMGGRRRLPPGPTQPAAPALAGASARLGVSSKLRSRQRALLAEGPETSSAHRQRGSSSAASSSSGVPRRSARVPIIAESQASTSAEVGGSSSSGEVSGVPGMAAERSGDASGELPGDGGFELLRRVPGIRTGRRVSFDASLGRASTDDDAIGGGAAPQSPTASSSESPDTTSDGGAGGIRSPWEASADEAGGELRTQPRTASAGSSTAAASRSMPSGLRASAQQPMVRMHDQQCVSMREAHCVSPEESLSGQVSACFQPVLFAAYNTEC